MTLALSLLFLPSEAKRRGKFAGFNSTAVGNLNAFVGNEQVCNREDEVNIKQSPIV